MNSATELEDNEPSVRTQTIQSQINSMRRMLSEQHLQQHDQYQQPYKYRPPDTPLPPFHPTKLKSSFSRLRAGGKQFDETAISPEIPKKLSKRGITVSFKDLVKKVSLSFKPRCHAQELGDRPRSAWARLRTAACHHSSQGSHSISLQRGGYLDTPVNTPIPGNGNQPPKIPYGVSGSAARAAAAAGNNLIPSNSFHNFYTVARNRQHPRPTEQQEDRESGIGIAVTNSSLNPTDNLDSPVFHNEISWVDFISQLPAELAIQILVFMDLKTLIRIATVSRQWLKISQSQSIWREVFLRDQTQTYAASCLLPLGAGLGLPAQKPYTDWKDLYRVREQLKQNWTCGSAEAVYLNGHTDSIYCVQFDEKKIITGSRDKTIRIWDLKNYVCTMIIGPPDVVSNPSMIRSHDGRSQHYAIMPDLTKVPAKTPPVTLSFPMHHNQSILCLQYDEKILVTGSSDGTCIIHDIPNGYQAIRQLRHHKGAVLGLAFDDRHIVTCSKDVTICIWDRESGNLMKQLRGHGGPVNAVQLRGNTIVSCSGDFRVKLWNIDTGKNINELVGHTHGVACSQFSEDARFIVSSGSDKAIRIWDANTGKALKTMHAHESLVRSLHVDSISGRLISGSYDQDIKVFDMASGAMLLDFPKWHASWVLGAKSDYRRIISIGQDPKILIMDFGKNIKGIEKLES